MPCMADILPNIPNNVAANMLKHERNRLETRRKHLTNEIKDKQHEIDKIDKRLKEVESGEQALNLYGHQQ